MIRAYGTTLIVKPLERATFRSSGLYIPDTNDERPQEGEIVSVGERVRNRDLKVGRSVYFGKFSPDALREGLLALREQDILAVIKDNEPHPLNRVLVKMIPISEDYKANMGQTLSKICLTIESKKKHFEHQFRRAEVMAIDSLISWHIPDVEIGSTVVIRGDAGFTCDGDIMDEEDKYDAPLKGEGWRWMKWKEILAVEEKNVKEACAA